MAEETRHCAACASRTEGRRCDCQGLRERHSRGCGSVGGGRCDCRPAYEAAVYSPLDSKKIRKTFSGKGAFAEAKRGCANWWTASTTPSASSSAVVPTSSSRPGVTLRP